MGKSQPRVYRKYQIETGQVLMMELIVEKNKPRLCLCP
jgi:hypothetical protein